MSPQEDYELVLTPPARRALSDLLPESVAAAVIDLVCGRNIIRVATRSTLDVGRSLSGSIRTAILVGLNDTMAP